MDRLLGTLKGAAEETRLRILALLGQGELTVSEMTQILSQSQPRVSRHLKLLVEANLLTRFREGTWVFYRLTDADGVRPLLNTILALIPESDADLARDFERLEGIRRDRADQAKSYFADNAADWDTTRQLYVGENVVEKAMLAVVGGGVVDSMLDVGTGTGRILEVFKDKFKQGIGVDLSLDMLAVARSNLSRAGVDAAVVRQGDMYDLPVLAATQDLVVFHQVLHFADDPLNAVKEAERVLRGGGSALLVDFAPHDLEYLRDDHAHRRLGFDDTEVETWARNAGLELSSTKDLKGGKLLIKIWHLNKPETNTGN